MTLNSTFALRGLGYLSYVKPPGPVTSLGVSTFYTTTQNASATWVLPTDTNIDSVEVEWSINNGAYGAPVVLAGTATSATRAITGGQTARARVRCKNTSGGYGDYTVSATITSPPEVATGVLASETATPGTVTVTWSNAATTTGVVLSRTVSGVTTDIGLGAVTTYTDTPGNSLVVQYRVTNYNGGGSAPASPVVSVTTTPAVPTVTSFTATNPGILTLSASAVVQSNLARYDIQLETAGVWGTSVQSPSSPNFTWTGATHGTIYRARVRAVDTFGANSAWATSASASAINDLVGPVVSTPTSVWSNAIPGFTVSWSTVTDALSPVSSVVIEVSYDNGGSIAEEITVGATGASTNHVVSSARRGGSVWYRVRAIDSRNNTSYSGWATNVAKPLGTFYVVAAQTWTWETAGTPSWRTDTDDVVSGRLDANYETQSGFWFYGTGVADTCKGYAPDSGTVLLQRQGTSGFSGAVNIGTHTSNTRPASAPTVSNIATGPSFAGVANQVLYHTITAGQLTALGNGNATGFASTDPGGYRRLAGVSSNGYSGMLTLTFT